MLHFHFSSRVEFKNLPELREKLKCSGGRLVIYHNVWSLFAISSLEPRLIHVAQHESRIQVGIRQSRRTLWAGWWSLTGAIQTGMALAHNLSGGLDVTYLYGGDEIVRSPEEEDIFTRQYNAQAQKIRRLGLLAGPLGFIVLAALCVGYVLAMTHIFPTNE